MLAVVSDPLDPVERVAEETTFSGVVRVDRDGSTVFAKAYGFAHRGHSVANTIDTQFGIASGLKGLTALTIVSLIEDGVLSLDTTARSVLGEDLPLIADDVTVEHLLAHRSGIGDYLDEDVWGDVADYVMPVPVTSSRRQRTSSACSMGTRRSSVPENSSRTATAASSCSR